MYSSFSIAWRLHSLHLLLFLFMLESCVGFNRTRNNLIYWTPHKTGSTSVRKWMRNITSEYNFSSLILSAPMPFAQYEDWYDRASRQGGELLNCSLLAGHIRIKPVSSRRNEQELGRVITTTRDVFYTSLSRFFHVTKSGLNENLFKANSTVRARFLRYFRGLSKCQSLRYHDGIDECNLKTVQHRISEIVDRIDCAIDTEDPDRDLKRICELLKLKSCPEMLHSNKNRKADHGRILDDKVLKAEIAWASWPAKLLRMKLLQKRCANMEDGWGWPSPLCLNDTLNASS